MVTPYQVDERFFRTGDTLAHAELSARHTHSVSFFISVAVRPVAANKVLQIGSTDYFLRR
jgi:hypothetical protein